MRAIVVRGQPATGVRLVKGALVLGLTGGIASGKSAAAQRFKQLGATVIDADQIAREVVRPGEPAYRALVAEFGPRILQTTQDGGEPPIDRAKLGALAFSDGDARSKLNSITHPAIAQRSAALIEDAASRGARVIIYEAALLVENKAYQGLDGLIVVDVPEALQRSRASARDGVPETTVCNRMRAQASRQTRLLAATWVILNDSDMASLHVQVDRLWEDFSAGRLPEPSRQKPA